MIYKDSYTFATHKILLLSVALVLLAAAMAAAQEADFTNKIRLQFWAELDAYPESAEAQNTSAPVFEYPITRLKQVAPYLINGLVYGYHFEYTPSDKARGVKEYFTVTPLGDISKSAGGLSYKSPISQNNLIKVWVEYEKTAEERLSNKAWGSVTHKKISGNGNARVEKGFDGIVECINDAIKSAVRNYFRKVTKNKPREITGDVIIKNDPVLGIKAGSYVIALDFFLDNDIIVLYNK